MKLTGKANNEKEAEEKAKKIPGKDWEELQSWNETGFIIDCVDDGTETVDIGNIV